MARPRKSTTNEEAATIETTTKQTSVRKKKTTSKIERHDLDSTDAMSGSDEKVEDEEELQKLIIEGGMELTTAKGILRRITNMFYQTQKRRIAIGNQLLSLLYLSLGFSPGEKISDEELKKRSKGFLNRLEQEFYSIHEQVADYSNMKMVKWFQEQSDLQLEYIRTASHYVLVEPYFQHRNMEHKLLQQIKACLVEHEIWNKFLINVKGCGPLTSAMIISFLDIHKSIYRTGLFSYCGFGVVPVSNPDNPEEVIWQGQSRKKSHLKEVEYTSRDGTVKTKLSCGYSPVMKTTMYKLATCFLKQNPEFKAIYDGYKHRQHQINAMKPDHQRLTNAHIHARAMRYIIKEFLSRLYEAWRPLEGLYVHSRYEEEKLGMKPHKADIPLSNQN